MKEFRQLTSTHFEYKKIAESQVYKDFELDEAAAPKLVFYLANYTPKKSVEDIFTYEEIKEELVNNSPEILKIFKFGFIPIGYYDGKYIAADKANGSINTLDSHIYQDFGIQAWEWDEARPYTKENVLLAARDWSYYLNVYEYFIQQIIDLYDIAFPTPLSELPEMTPDQLVKAVKKDKKQANTRVDQFLANSLS